LFFVDSFSGKVRMIEASIVRTNYRLDRPNNRFIPGNRYLWKM